MENKDMIVDMVDDQAMITIELPGYMFIRLNQLLMTGIGLKSPEHMLEIAQKVKEGKLDKENTVEYHAETIMYINAVISMAAKEQKKTKPFKLDVNTGLGSEIPPPQSPSE